MSFWSRLTRRFSSTSLDSFTPDEVYEWLVLSDVGHDLAEYCAKKFSTPASLTKFFHETLSQRQRSRKETPHLVMMVGVNGSGKTTTLAKLAFLYQRQKMQPYIVGADTFRVAAQDQLAHWAESLNIPHRAIEGKSACAAAVEGVREGKKGHYCPIFVDTAGRLHTHNNLMDELKKVHKTLCTAFHDVHVLMVVDGSNGTNAQMQVQLFDQYLPLSGLIVTKLDTATKGGIVFRLAHTFSHPIEFLGCGESIEDLQPFCADSFVTWWKGTAGSLFQGNCVNNVSGVS